MHIATNNPICNYKNFESETSGTHKNHSLVHWRGGGGGGGGGAEISAITTDHIGVFVLSLRNWPTIPVVARQELRSPL